MKVAVPVKNRELDLFANAGHAPYFAIYQQKGSGMFRSFELLELRDNPRVNMEAEFGCQREGEEHHEHGDDEHAVLGELVHDCSKVGVIKACERAAKAMNERGAQVVKLKGGKNAKEILNSLL